MDGQTDEGVSYKICVEAPKARLVNNLPMGESFQGGVYTEKSFRCSYPRASTSGSAQNPVNDKNDLLILESRTSRRNE